MVEACHPACLHPLRGGSLVEVAALLHSQVFRSLVSAWAMLRWCEVVEAPRLRSRAPGFTYSCVPCES